MPSDAHDRAPCDVPGARLVRISNGEAVWRHPVDCPIHDLPVLSRDGVHFSHLYTADSGRTSTCFMMIPEADE